MVSSFSLSANFNKQQYVQSLKNQQAQQLNNAVNPQLTSAQMLGGAQAQDGTGMPSIQRKRATALTISGKRTNTIGGRKNAGDGTTFATSMLGGLV